MSLKHLCISRREAQRIKRNRAGRLSLIRTLVIHLKNYIENPTEYVCDDPSLPRMPSNMNLFDAVAYLGKRARKVTP